MEPLVSKYLLKLLSNNYPGKRPYPYSAHVGGQGIKNQTMVLLYQ